MDVVGVPALLPPAALDGVPRHLCVVSRHDGVSRGLLGGESRNRTVRRRWMLLVVSA